MLMLIDNGGPHRYTYLQLFILAFALLVMLVFLCCYAVLY